MITIEQARNNSVICISGKDDEWFCAIMPDGSFEYGGSYNPDEASIVFWKAVSKQIKSMQPNSSYEPTEKITI